MTANSRNRSCRTAMGSNPRAATCTMGWTTAGGRRSDDFKPSFRDVRRVCRQEAPEVLFAFSPAIRADLDEAKITDFWPGDEAVDVIAGTWYVHAEEQFHDATHNMRAYFLHRLG